MLGYFLIEKPAVDHQTISGLRLIARSEMDCIFNEFFFKHSNRFVEGHGKQFAIHEAGTRWGRWSLHLRKMSRHDDTAAGHQNGALDDALQLANISGKGARL